MPTIAKNY